VFTESLQEFPRGFKPNSVITVKRGPKVLYTFACTRDQFWVEIVDNTPETKVLVSDLEKRMKNNSITQVR